MIIFGEIYVSKYFSTSSNSIFVYFNLFVIIMKRSLNLKTNVMPPLLYIIQEYTNKKTICTDYTCSVQFLGHYLPLFFFALKLPAHPPHLILLSVWKSFNFYCCFNGKRLRNNKKFAITYPLLIVFDAQCITK